MKIEGKFIFKVAGTLTAISLVVALLLGLTNEVTAPFIEANNWKTTQEAMNAVLPADEYTDVTADYAGGDTTVEDAVTKQNSHPGVSYGQMLRNARVHDSDGLLTDHENAASGRTA